MKFRYLRKWLIILYFIGQTGYLIYRWLTYVPFAFTPRGFRRNDIEVRQEMHFSRYKFLKSDEFEKEVGGWDTFAAKPQQERCEAFFSFVNLNLPDWKAGMLRKRVYNKNVVNKAGYFSDSQARVIKNRQGKGAKSNALSNEDRHILDSWYAETLRNTMDTEQEMADTMYIIRMFGHCFLGAESSKQGKFQELYNLFLSKVLPYFAKDLPEVKGLIGPNSFFSNAPAFSGKSTLVEYYFENILGTGIVVSAATKHVRDLVKLIHLLRALGNTLPIQIMYRTDVLNLGKMALEQAASVPKSELLGEDRTDRRILKHSLEQLGLGRETIDEREFPTQDVTFVDMHTPLRDMTKAEFYGYKNKIAAFFFNSFRHVILLDADTVPLKSPEVFFKIKEYVENGAYFFKDRTLMDKNSWVETNHFAKLMPQKTDYLGKAMGVTPVSNHTMRNEYMQGWRHCQEAGVVLLDRKAHFLALLVLITLSLWGEPTKSSVWGDKELYWLAMSIAGDERYSFNAHSAASIGELTAENSIKQYNTTTSLELCSSHPGHITADGELLWINSGFSYCKMNGFSRDLSKFPFYLFEDKSSGRMTYESALKIRAAIIPPIVPALRELDGPADQASEVAFGAFLTKRKKDVDQLKDVPQIGEYGPQKGWVKSPLCLEYQYCAYSEISSLQDPGGVDVGKVFTFDPEATKNFDILGMLWLSAKRHNSKMDNSRLKQKAKQSQKLDVLKQEKALTPEGKVLNLNPQEKAVLNQPKSAPEVDFDPSRVLERPEKLKLDVNAFIEKLKKGLTKG